MSGLDVTGTRLKISTLMTMGPFINESRGGYSEFMTGTQARWVEYIYCSSSCKFVGSFPSPFIWG